MIKYLFVTASMTVLLGACAQPTKTAPGRVIEKPVPVQETSTQNVSIPIPVTISPATGNERLLEYAGRFVDLSPEAQKKELAQVNQSLSQNKNDLGNRMKAALIYALPKSRLRDISKAQILLDDLLREKTLDTERRTLAEILRDNMAESSKLLQKMHDEQKRTDALQQKLDAAQQRADALQQKLDDLKTIEKTMIDRDAGTRK